MTQAFLTKFAWDLFSTGGGHALHGALVFPMLFLHAVVLRVKLGDAIQLFLRDRIQVGRLRELDELLFVVNVRERRGDGDPSPRDRGEGPALREPRALPVGLALRRRVARVDLLEGR